MGGNSIKKELRGKRRCCTNCRAGHQLDGRRVVEFELVMVDYHPSRVEGN
jgi:hypothetical protein